MTNKIGVFLGAAAIVVAAGCQDPNYVRKNPKAQDEVKNLPAEQATPVVTPDVTPVENPEPAEATPVISEEPVAPAEAKALPGAPEEPVVAPAPEKPAENVTTPYIVQRGDYLAKISKKFNVKLDALRAANPKLKNNVVRLGQTIQIPGKVDVGEQTIPEGAIAKPVKKAAPEYKPYTGETKEYVVKSGDYLGKIAAKSKISVRQLKELNDLKSDVVRVGQKLRVPATAAAPAAAPAANAAPAPAPAKTVAPAPAPAVEEPASAVEVPASVEQPVVAAPVETPVPAAEPDDDSIKYVVQDGEDIISLSISFGVDPSVIRELNNMGEQDQVKPGQVIKLPAEAN